MASLAVGIDMASTNEIVASFQDASALESAKDYLRDGLMPSDGIVYDKASHELGLSFRQPDFARSEYKRLCLCFWQRVTPLRCWAIVFRGVRAFEIDQGVELRRPQDHSLANVRYSEGRIQVITHEAVTITIHVERIEGTVLRREELDSTRSLKSVVICLRPPVGAALRR